MAGTDFLHGVEVIEIDNGPRPIRTVRSSVIGLVGTAPDADASVFPLNKPVLVAGSRQTAASLDTVGDGNGSLPGAIDAIFDQVGAMVVVVRVEEGADAAETTENILGGVNGTTGKYEGMYAFLGAQSELGVTPRILCAPDFTGSRVDDGVVSIAVDTAGTGYAQETTTVTITGDGSGAKAEAVVDGSGTITAITVTNPGVGYTTATVAIAGDGSGATASATIGEAANAVVAEMIGIAERLRAVIIADGPNTNDADAIKYRGDWGSKRVYVVDPKVLISPDGTALVQQAASARIAGLIAKTDNERGFWWSPSNQTINGIVGTAREIDFTLGDINSRANYLNENEVATIIREDGYRLWGNRTCSDDPKWAFLNVVRTADIINDSLLRAHLWAVDRNITKTYLEDVVEGVNAYLRELTALGAILGGQCWADPDLNTPASISDGKVWFNFDFTPPYPAEHVIFRSHLVTDYIEEII